LGKPNYSNIFFLIPIDEAGLIPKEYTQMMTIYNRMGISPLSVSRYHCKIKKIKMKYPKKISAMDYYIISS